MSWQLAVAGALTGLLVGATGMGGGSLMTPMLVLLFGMPPVTAIGTDLAHGAAFKTVGAILHRRLGNVKARLAGWMFVGSAPMSLVGVWLSARLGERYGSGMESPMGRVLGISLLLSALGLVAKTFVPIGEDARRRWRLSRRDRIAAVLIGAVGGFVVGLTSLGSGVFFGLTLLILFPLRARKVVGTDLFHAAALLYVAAAGHWLAGNVDLHALAWLLVGSIPGVLLGARLTLAIPEQLLRLMLAGVLALAGTKLVGIPGAEVLAAVGLCAGVASAVALAGRHGWSHVRRGRDIRVRSAEE